MSKYNNKLEIKIILWRNVINVLIHRRQNSTNQHRLLMELILRDQIKRCFKAFWPFWVLTSSKVIGLLVKKNGCTIKNVAFSENKSAREHWEGLDKNKRVQDKYK